jgi:hypothetical protein
MPEGALAHAQSAVQGLSKYTTEASGSWQFPLYCCISRTALLTAYAFWLPAHKSKLTSTTRLQIHHILSKEGESGHSPRILQLVTEVEAMLDCFYAALRGQLAAVLMDMYCVYAHLGDTASAARIYKRLIRNDRILKGRDKPSVENVLVTAVDFTGGPSTASSFETAEARCCVYCEASLSRRDLSRCDACEKVGYCGRACQKAHWGRCTRHSADRELLALRLCEMRRWLPKQTSVRITVRWLTLLTTISLPSDNPSWHFFRLYLLVYPHMSDVECQTPAECPCK